jgi:hypothetical protein
MCRIPACSLQGHGRVEEAAEHRFAEHDGAWCSGIQCCVGGREVSAIICVSRGRYQRADEVPFLERRATNSSMEPTG